LIKLKEAKENSQHQRANYNALFAFRASISRCKAAIHLGSWIASWRGSFLTKHGVAVKG